MTISDAAGRVWSGLLGRQGQRAEAGPEAAPPPELRLSLAATLMGSDFLAANGADITAAAEDGSALVTTSRELWAYAAQLRLAEVTLPSEGPLLIRLDLCVHRGWVGVGVTGPDGQFVGEQQIRSLADGLTAVDLRLDAADQPSEIILRNAGRMAAKATLERVRIYRIDEDPMQATDLLGPSGASPQSQPLSKAWAKLTGRSIVDPASPLVSLILTVRNGMPYLPEAIASVRRQTYRNFELVVQDCISEDGSSDFLAAVRDIDIKLVRELDGGIGDANNRALARSRGAIVGTIDADNLMAPDALDRVVDHYRRRPGDAVVYGDVAMINADGTPNTVFEPPAFDFIKFIGCEISLPWSTAYFSRATCGDALQMTSNLKTCVDFDVWLRLSHLPLTRLGSVLGSTRLSENSMSCRPENYGQFCEDKIAALRRYVADGGHQPVAASLLRYGAVGIYCWAAESVNGLAPDRDDIVSHFYERAKTLDPKSPRVAQAATRLFP